MLPPSNQETEYLKALTALATVCRFQLTPYLINLYVEGVREMGYDKAYKAVTSIFFKRRTNDNFPSVGDIVSYSDCNELSAIELAQKIWNSISIYGYNNEGGAKMFVGPVGSAVIDNFGWGSLCEATTDQGPAIMAQLREAIKATTERMKHKRMEKSWGQGELEDHTKQEKQRMMISDLTKVIKKI